MTSTAWPRLFTNHIGINTFNLDSYNLSLIGKKTHYDATIIDNNRRNKN